MSDNVQVAVRVRPFNSRENGIAAPCCIAMEGQQTKLINPKDGNERPFNFDHSFWSHKSEDPHFKGQEDVFKALGLPCLDNSFQGYNACIFAYGQTGSGKTHTMIGHDEADPGLIPRLCTALFDRVAETTKEGLTFKVEVSYMELYNEHVYDLLSSAKGGKRTALKVRQHKILGPYVEGLKRLAVTNFEAVEILMEEGNKSRTTASTKMNATSSRSHAVFSLFVTQAQYDPATKQTGEKTSKISLVDLAGSERQSKTQASGARLKEGANINKSLTTLGLVIHSLAGGEKFIPYRDSILTFLLKDSLGGNSKTLMMAAISPAGDSYDETLSTLRFADRAKSIKNHAVVNEDPNAKLIRELREELERLRAEAAGRDPAAQPDNSELEAMKAKLAETEGFIAELSQSWEEKLKTTQSILEQRQAMLDEHGASVSQSGDALVVGSSLPHFLTLMDDPLATSISMYTFKEGITTLGSITDNDPTTYTIEGLDEVHCTIRHEVVSEIGDNGQELLEKVYILPQGPVLINGAAISEEVPLSHGNLIKLNTRMFRFSHPTEAARLRKMIAEGGSGAEFARSQSQASLDSAKTMLNPMAAIHEKAQEELDAERERVAASKKKMVASKWKLAHAAEKTRLAREQHLEEQRKLAEQHRLDAARLDRERQEFEEMKQRELAAQQKRMAELAAMEPDEEGHVGSAGGAPVAVGAVTQGGAVAQSAASGGQAAGVATRTSAPRQAGAAATGSAAGHGATAGTAQGAQSATAAPGVVVVTPEGAAKTHSAQGGSEAAAVATSGHTQPTPGAAAMSAEKAQLASTLSAVEGETAQKFEPVKPQPTNVKPPKLEMFWEIATDKKYKYQFCPSALPDNPCLVAWITAKSDAHIALAAEPKNNAHMYELVIGCKDNTECQIRRSKMGKPVSRVNVPFILAEDSVRSFWVLSSGGNIMIGLGEVPGKRLVVHYADSDPMAARYIGVTTGWGSAGQWKFAMPNVDAPSLVKAVLEEQRLREGTELFKDLADSGNPLEPYWAEGYVFHTQYTQKFRHEYYTVVVTGQHLALMIKPHVHAKSFGLGTITSLLDTAAAKLGNKSGLKLEQIMDLAKVTNVKTEALGKDKLMILEAGGEKMEVPILQPNGELLASCIIWMIRRVQRLRRTHAPTSGAVPTPPTRKSRSRAGSTNSPGSPVPPPRSNSDVKFKRSQSQQSNVSLEVPDGTADPPVSPRSRRRLPPTPGQKH